MGGRILRCFILAMTVMLNGSNIFAQEAPWWWTYPTKLPIGNNFDYIPCMGEGMTETDARRKAEAESYRMFTAKNKYVEFSEMTYREIEEKGLKATLPEYATNYTFVCNPAPEKISDTHYKVYILYAWRRDFSKPADFSTIDGNICNSPNEFNTQTKLVSPEVVVLNGYLFIYPNDLGRFSSIPFEEIRQINDISMYGINTWRMPTREELRMIEANRDKLKGLNTNGGVYKNINDDNSYAYYVRLVSTGFLPDHTLKDFVELATERIAVHTKDITYESGGVSWKDAKKLCENSSVGGYTDWRMPTINELYAIFLNKELVNVSKGKYGYGSYWSSSFNGLNYIVLDFASGTKKGYPRNQWSFKCRCVRSLP